MTKQLTIPLSARQIRYLKKLDNGDHAATINKALTNYEGERLWSCTLDDKSEYRYIDVNVDMATLAGAVRLNSPTYWKNVVDNRTIAKSQRIDYPDVEFIRRVVWRYLASVLGEGVLVERGAK